MENRKILFVDDETNVLQAFRRIMHNNFQCEYTEFPKKVLDILGKDNSYAVIIADMNMPEINGIELLKRVKESFPDITRIMLTGNADMMTAINAVNEGHIYRFLTKPCPNELLLKTIKAGIDQYNLVTAEKELLEKTLKGSINTIMDMLLMINPKVFRIQNQIKKYTMKIVTKSALKDAWKYEIASMLSQIGVFSLPQELIDRIYAFGEVSAEEMQLFRQHPQVGRKILTNIPRISQVAAMIGGQMKSYEEYNHEKEVFNEIYMGAQLLKLVTDYIYLLNSGVNKDNAYDELKKNSKEYNKYFLELLSTINIEKQEEIYKSLFIKEMLPGMILDQDIKAKNGIVVIKKGQEITLNIIETLKSFNEGIGIVEPIRVIISD